MSEEVKEGDSSLFDFRKERAAQLLADGSVSGIQIAAGLDVSHQTLWRWQHEPEFIARVAEYKKTLANSAQHFLIAKKEYRIGNLQERLIKMRRLIEERAKQAIADGYTGNNAGLMVKRTKMVGKGKEARVVEEYEFDAALVKEMRETERQAAIECGQWTEKKEVGGLGGGPLMLQVIEEVVSETKTGEDTATSSAETVPGE